MFENIFLEMLHNVWPMLMIFLIIIVSIRLFYLISNKKQIILYKELLMLSFVIYILLLYYIVTFQDNNYGTNNFVPFREIFRYKITSKLFIRNVLGNILLFLPFGIFTTHYVNNKKIYATFFLSLIATISIEFVQLSIGRTCDVDDIILNTVGGILGFIVYRLWWRITDKLPKFIKSSLFLDSLSFVCIIVLLYLAFKFDFWRIFS